MPCWCICNALIVHICVIPPSTACCKARALQHAVEGGITQMWTISALQMHQHGIIVCDEAATDELKVGTYKYFKDIEKANL